MKEDDITFVNVVVDLIRCYCHDNNSEPDQVFSAISMAFNKDKESENGNGHQTGNI